MDESGLDALAALVEPIRRQLYTFVAEAGTAVSRDDAAQAAGVGRSLAAYHLDRLVADGLLVVSYERRSGRSGPGAGRPAKLYQRATNEVVVQIPARDDAFVGSLLATSVAGDRSGAAQRRLHAAAGKAGEGLAGSAVGTDGLLSLLSERGYEPTASEDAIRLRNCPFHHLVLEHRELVCSMNLRLLRGVLRGSRNEDEFTAVLDPHAESCCVILRRR